MNCKIFKPKEIDLNNIVYSTIVKKSNNVQSIYIAYNENGVNLPLFIRLPSLYLVDGIKEIDGKHTTHEFVLLLQSKTKENSECIIKLLKDLDKKIVKDGRLNKYSWDTDQELTYKVLSRKVNNDNTIYNNGVLKVKLYKNGQFKTNVYYNKQLINDNNYKDLFNRHCYVKVIIEIVSLIKDIDGIFELFIRTHQISVNNDAPPINLLDKYQFSDSSDTYKNDDIDDASIRSTLNSSIESDFIDNESLSSNEYEKNNKEEIKNNNESDSSLELLDSVNEVNNLEN